MTSIGLKPRPAGTGPPPRRPPRAAWHAVANGVVLAWLALTAVAALVHPELPAPRWLLIHLFLLGAVTNAIVTWTEHFAAALLRVPPPPRWWPMTRLAVLNAGIAAVLGGVADGTFPLIAVGGAATVACVVAAHVAVLVVRGRGALGGRFAHVVGWYVWAGVALVAGGTFGGLMASGCVPSGWHGPLQDAHAHVNILGWVGLTVLGTLFTLWPTVLRTRMVDGTGRIARWSLRAAVPGLAVAVGGLLADLRWLAAAGLLLYAAAAGLALVPFVRTLVQRHPHTPASWMLAAGTAWFAVTLVADAARQSLGGLLALVLVGFVGQTLLGALTFLLPVVLGGGPAALKANAAVIERLWTPRVIAVNAAVPLLVLPVPEWAARAAWIVVIAALGAFVLLAAATVVRSHRPSPVVAGIAAGVLLTALAVGVAAGNQPSTSTVAASGTRTVDVTLVDMRIRPGTIEAEPGTRLILRVTNQDAMRHDLRLASGEATPMLDQGETATLTLPPLEGPIDGWCTVPGHRAAGMTMKIEMTGTGSAAPPAGHHHAVEPGQLDLAAPMSPQWRPYDAALKPAPGAKEHRVEIRATEQELEVAPGVRQEMWTFNGTVPGPVLRGKVGDVFTITLINDAAMGHGIDFHAGSLAPDVPMRTIQPGESLTYRFKAEHAGAWLYHCSTMPMLQHMGNGMYGAVIIDPPGLPAVDREYVLVQGELYLGEPGSAEQMAKMRDGRPDAWTFNGTAAGYDHAPLTARTGDRVRVWVVDAGPASGTAFHIVGAQFDTVYKEGAYLLRKGDDGGAQILDLAPGQGGFVETVVPEAGHYPFVDHDMRHGEAGAHGILKVTG